MGHVVRVRTEDSLAHFVKGWVSVGVRPSLGTGRDRALKVEKRPGFASCPSCPSEENSGDAVDRRRGAPVTFRAVGATRGRLVPARCDAPTMARPGSARYRVMGVAVVRSIGDVTMPRRTALRSDRPPVRSALAVAGRALYALSDGPVLQNPLRGFPGVSRRYCRCFWGRVIRRVVLNLLLGFRPLHECLWRIRLAGLVRQLRLPLLYSLVICSTERRSWAHREREGNIRDSCSGCVSRCFANLCDSSSPYSCCRETIGKSPGDSLRESGRS